MHWFNIDGRVNLFSTEEIKCFISHLWYLALIICSFNKTLLRFDWILINLLVYSGSVMIFLEFITILHLYICQVELKKQSLYLVLKVDVEVNILFQTSLVSSHIKSFVLNAGTFFDIFFYENKILCDRILQNVFSKWHAFRYLLLNKPWKSKLITIRL